MSHECEDCGETFETLTRLRLHDCSSTKNPGNTGESEADDGARGQRIERLLNAADDGDYPALHEAVVIYRSMLESALERDDDTDTYRDVFWEYYEPLANGFDGAVKAEGWSFLQEFVARYHPSTSEGIPLVSPVIENAVGRYVVRTRLSDGVASISTEALAYLEAIAVEATENHDIEREESHPYGWGIGHPDHPVADRLCDRARNDVFWVNGALEHALYADQNAAVDLLERMIRDSAIQQSISYRTGEIDETRYLLDAVGGADSNDFQPTNPRYWDWHDDLDASVDWDGETRQRLRDLVAESGVENDLPDGWTFADLTL